MNVWENVYELLKDSINRQSFDTWLAPIDFVSYEQDTLILKAKSKFYSDWIEQNYTELISNKAEAVVGKPVKVKIIVEEEKTQIITNKQISPSNKAYANKNSGHLNDSYVFDNFVIGNSNQFACSAAQAVAEAPGKTKFNPLLIYGGAGLGKTHLVQAIGHYVQKNLRDAKIYYTTSEQFTFDFIESIKNNKIAELSNYYRSADVLLMDDIQFFIGKDRTQEEFFHIFNTLYQNNKQIVLSSDRAPKDLQGMEERLVSRFQWGLFVDIQPPDKETRIAIIKKKTEKEGIEIDGEVANFIADNVSSNIRELEGSIIRLIAYSTMVKKDVNVELAREILKINTTNVKKRISVDDIVEKVSKFYDVLESSIRGKGRNKEIVLPRMVSMYLAKQLTTYSLKSIGAQFGGRDHSTVIHSIQTVEEKIGMDNSFKNEVENIKKELFDS